MNYQFAQPMLYTYIANIMAGSLSQAIKGVFDDEEESTEADKALLSSTFAGNLQAIPVIGGILLATIDKLVLQKEFTFATVVGSPLYDEIKKVEKHVGLAVKSKKEDSKKRHIFEATKKTAGIITGIPNITFDFANEWDDVYWNDDISFEGKSYRALGYSKFAIEPKTGDDFTTEKTAKELSPEERRENALEKRRKAQEKRNNRN